MKNEQSVKFCIRIVKQMLFLRRADKNNAFGNNYILQAQ